MCRGTIWRVVLLTVFGSLASAIGVTYTIVLKNVIDSATVKNKEDFIKGIIIFILLVFTSVILRALSRRLDESVRARTENKLKSYIYNISITREYASISRYHTGDLLFHMSDDTTIIADGLASILPNVISMIVKLIGAAVILFMLDWRFAIIFMIGGIIILLLTHALRKIMKRLHKEVQSAGSYVRSYLQETLTNLLVLRTFGNEANSTECAKERMEAHRRVRMKRNTFTNVCNIGLALAMNTGYLFGLVWCGLGIFSGSITYGTLTAVLQLVGQIQQPFMSMSGYLPRYYSMLGSAERLMAIEDLPPDGDGTRLTVDEAKTLYSHLKCIRIDKVTFTYPTLDDIVMPEVLKDAELVINKGEYVAITGQSGIGKSTLLKLLLAIYKPSEGAIIFQKSDESEININPSIRSVFTYVPQGNHLLSGTVAQAVSFNDSLIDMDKVKTACRMACIDEVIEELPEGYNTMIGEQGEGLSEGQNQRLAIARAIYSGAPIMLLDEATSALDNYTEQKVLMNLKATSDITVIIITHRKAALSVCNRIITVEKLGFVEKERSRIGETR